MVDIFGLRRLYSMRFSSLCTVVGDFLMLFAINPQNLSNLDSSRMTAICSVVIALPRLMLKLSVQLVLCGIASTIFGLCIQF